MHQAGVAASRLLLLWFAGSPFQALSTNWAFLSSKLKQLRSVSPGNRASIRALR